MAIDIKGDTDRVREEFDGLTKPTQIFVAVLVALGIVIGFLLGGALGYGTAVEELDDNCIEYEDERYCPDDGAAAPANGATDPADDDPAEPDDTDGLDDDGLDDEAGLEGDEGLEGDDEFDDEELEGDA